LTRKIKAAKTKVAALRQAITLEERNLRRPRKAPEGLGASKIWFLIVFPGLNQ